ncbi:fatty acyl-AMP ligase [Caulobacter sp. S45]|uniref:fatty acyl-AMP ligase n=1 Tax=Caulobacter sp. S45 TaxID=1641861 RepID=UPI0015773ED9|nr:fatty acyl-AMP ligase [Caulobacter sp. S45]
MSPTPTSPDRTLPATGHPTLAAALDAAAQQPTGLNIYGLRGELVEAVPYAGLRERALALAGRLQASGLAPGDRVGLVAETSATFVTSFFACQYAGLVPAPMPLPAPLGGGDAYVDQIARLLTQAHASAAFGPEALQPLVAAAGARAGLRQLAPLAELPKGEVERVEATPEDTCYLQFSSGSTRTPTGVVVTHRAVRANAHAITRHGLAIGAGDRAFSWLPLFHDMGLVGFLLSPLTVAMSVDLMPSDAFVRRPLLWPRLIGQTGATISYSPSFGYELCARRAETADLSDLDLSRWRVAGVGGDMVRAGPLTAFADRFAASGFDARAFVASYGMAEATLALAMSPLGQGVRKEILASDRLERGGRAVAGAGYARRRDFVRCGPVLPGHELEVRDEAGAPLPDRHLGRIFVRGPSLMRGYFDQPDATSAVLGVDGWLDTGDLGFLADGELTPTGRAKDLILHNGRNIWPQDLEWTAEAEIVGLRSGDVAAFQAEEDGPGVIALVQTRVRDPAARARLAADIAGLLRARHGVETEVRLVGPGALPQTSSGKLRRARARELFLVGAFETA